MPEPQLLLFTVGLFLFLFLTALSVNLVFICVCSLCFCIFSLRLYLYLDCPALDFNFLTCKTGIIIIMTMLMTLQLLRTVRKTRNNCVKMLWYRAQATVNSGQENCYYCFIIFISPLVSLFVFLFPCLCIILKSPPIPGSFCRKLCSWLSW